MATYKEIFGKQVKFLSTDPVLQSEGQIWYNSTTATFRSTLVSAAWASSSNMSNAKAYRFGGGTTNAAFAAGGSPFPIASTEEYNGSGWSAGGDLGTARYEGASAGTQTAGLVAGGITTTPQSGTEEYDGSSWTAGGGALNTARYSQGGFGVQTAAVYSSGFPGTLTDTEEYNGTSWSEGNNQSQHRGDVGTAGTLTAGMIFGGQGPGPTVYANTELYDGTNWTAGPAMNSARGQLGGSGTQTAAIGFGGRYTPPGSVLRAYTEQYDGTSWSETADLATARRQLSSTRVETGNTSALAFGGSAPSVTAITEEFNQSATAITAGAWASGGALTGGVKNAVGGAGTQTTGLAFGGYKPGSNQTDDSESYDGTTWTEGSNLNTARSFIGGETYDGSTWT